MARENSIQLYKRVDAELKSARPKPVYYLAGEEAFFIERLQTSAISRVSPDLKDFNLDILYGQDTNLQKVVGICRSYPMMAEMRIVILREFHSLFKKEVTGGDQEVPGSNYDELIPYLEQPNPTTLLVITDGKAPAGNTRLGKLIKNSEHVGLYVFDQVPHDQVPDWVTQWVNVNYQRQIEPVAAELMYHFVGSDLQLLSTELDKVCTYKKTDAPINEEDVRSVIGVYRPYTVIELKKALISKKKSESLFIAEQMLHKSQSDAGEVIRTIGFFYSVFSNIWQLQRLSQKGLGRDQIMKEMGLRSTYHYNGLASDARAFGPAELPAIFEALLDADMAIKGYSKLDPETVLMMMIKRIVG
ncbi:MAG: DNA polymerase III subunit delta [Cyclonatronaceae bacterium]